MPGIGLLSIGTREKDSRKADVLGRWICCLWGGDVPAGMPVSISERANGAFGFPSLASYKNYTSKCIQPLGRRKTPIPPTPELFLASLTLQRIPKDPDSPDQLLVMLACN